MRDKLEEIEDEFRKGRMRGRLNDLWASLARAVYSSIERGEWAVDDEGLVQIVQVGFCVLPFLFQAD